MASSTWRGQSYVLLLGVAVTALVTCRGEVVEPTRSTTPEAKSEMVLEDTDTRDPWVRSQRAMVSSQIAGRDVEKPRVLEAMRTVPRHEFVPARYRSEAYRDSPLPIGHGQTISQPYIVAKMTELAQIDEGDKVLEIGTGSGYQAAVLAAMGATVYSIEIVPELAERAATTLKKLDYKVTVRAGDGYKGWPEHGPFDVIMVTAAPVQIPEPLIEQLAVGGRMVIPVGDLRQDLMLLTKDESGLTKKVVLPVRFVPMTGKALEDLKGR